MKNLETKKDIRQQIYQKRQQLDPFFWQKNTDRITDVVIAHPWFREAWDIYCYIDYHGETGTRKIIQEAWKLGKNVWIPKVDKENMEFFQIHHFEELHSGIHGIMEPEKGMAAKGREGLMIMPGVAFDGNRNRIGYGGGYYDKYLSKHSELQKLAIAFEFQVLEKIPQEENDIRPEILITESRVISDV